MKNKARWRNLQRISKGNSAYRYEDKPTHNGSNNPHDDDKATDNIQSSPERYDQRRSNVGDLRPVKSHGEQSKARSNTKLYANMLAIAYQTPPSTIHLVDRDSTHQIRHNNIPRRKPRHHIEPAQRWKQQPRQEVERDAARKHVREEAEPRHGPAVGGPVLVLVQAGEHGRRDERARPDHAAGLDEEAPRQAGQGVAQDLRREGEQDLVGDGEVLVVEFCLLDDDLLRG